MKDPRIMTLANNLVTYSCQVKKNEKVLIEMAGTQYDFTAALVESVYEAGGIPFVNIINPFVTRSLQKGYTEEQLELMAKYDSLRMSDCQAYIGVRCTDNCFESSDVSPDKMTLYSKIYGKKVHTMIRIPRTKWVVLRYPNQAMAQQACMSTPAFEDYYFNVCCLDYAKMSAAMDPLVKRMKSANKVRITGKDTDISFSIKGQPAIKCDGRVNIPDGELFTAPLRESVNGYIMYNTPSLYNGRLFEHISLVFKNGKITEASCNDTEHMNEILDTDEGARYVGEFAFGVNPYITTAIKDTLFDEKIAGSFHFTPGSCYDECPNNNKSAIHWDLVAIQTPEYGGGRIYFDDELIRENGLFVPVDLQGLNPDALK